jgi:CPA1 family monovalent cation:H+ antiporter
MSEISVLVFGLAGLLLLVSFLPPLAQRLRVPDTVLMAVLGCALGLAVGVFGGIAGVRPGLGPILDFLAGLGEIELSSQLFLAVFLPILLFETALRLDGRALVQDLGPVLVMAVVAVVVTTFVAGGAVWAVSDLPLAVGLLVAAIIATTDPAAVVAVFREVGAPRRLTTLVEGESLLNDAAAIALFGAILQVLAGGLAPHLGRLLGDFAWDFLGGVGFGALLGRIGAFALARLDRGGPAEITLSVALAYLAYAAAEAYLAVSGVVAVVIAGLVYGDAARARLAAEAWQALLAIWAQVAFWASSLIFVLATMLVPSTLRAAGPDDLLLLVALILGALAARALVLFTVLPIVVGRAEGRVVRADHRLVMLWGGLRGAVTLALALAVREEQALAQPIRDAVSIGATGFVLFTLLVQATTLRPLIRRLGLDQLTPAERMLRERALDVTRAEIADRLRAAAARYGLDASEPPDTPRGPPAVAGLPAEEELTRQHLITALATLARREIELCVEQRARRLVPHRTGSQLIAEARALLDAVRGDGLNGYRKAARRFAGLDRATRLAAFAHRRLRLQRPLALLLARRFPLLLMRREVLQELLDFTHGRIDGLFGHRIAEAVARMLEGRLLDAERGLDALRLQYPDYWRALSERQLQRLSLRLEEDGVARMAGEGLLSPEIERHLRAELHARERAIEAVPPLDLGLEVSRLLRRMPLFAELGEDRLRELAALLTPRLALPGEPVVRRHARGDEMFFIASGAVEVVLQAGRVRLGTGDFFGELALLTGRPRNADVVALGYCRLLVLRRDAFDRFLGAHPELVETVRRTASERAGRPLDLLPSGHRFT